MYMIGIIVVCMALYFFLGQPVMMDDGFQYQGFTEMLGNGVIDFGSYYGFHGLSFLALPVYLLTKSHISIIITSIIFVLLTFAHYKKTDTKPNTIK